ncbi:hypothetical protein BB560_003993, partial [Smittium megazygosporum]
HSPVQKTLVDFMILGPGFARAGPRSKNGNSIISCDIYVQRFGFRALPLNPLKVYRRANALFFGILDGIGGPTIPIFFAFFKQRFLHKNSKPDTSITGISYGPLPRHKMDLFLPVGPCTSNKGEITPKVPVIIVFPGYSWSNTSLIQLYSPMAQTLCETGLIVEWTYNNIGKSGADPEQIHLFGFGAGAHMCCMYNTASILSGLSTSSSSGMLSKILPSSNSNAELLEWLRRLRKPVVPVLGIILVSGVYSLEKQRKYEESRCIESISMSSRLFDNPDFAEAWSPLNIMSGIRKSGLFVSNSLFAKRVLIVHGQKDSTFPLELAQKLFQEFCLMDMDDVNMKVYANLRRIDPSVILSVQDALLAKSFLEDIRSAIFVDESDVENETENPQDSDKGHDDHDLSSDVEDMNDTDEDSQKEENLSNVLNGMDLKRASSNASSASSQNQLEPNTPLPKNSKPLSPVKPIS